MNKTTVRQALLAHADQKRTRPLHTPSPDFLMGVSFRRGSGVTFLSCVLAARLNAHFTQRVVAEILGVSLSRAIKMIRIGSAPRAE